MRYHEIMEKSEPNNPQLWGRAKAEASKRYKKHSAYKMGWASKWYKEHGGTWKTVSETVEDMITEISRPDTKEEAIELLISKGYEKIGEGSFGDVFSKGDKVIKLFDSNDHAYLAFLKMVYKNQSNPHFPKVYGKPIKITNNYYGIKLEKLEKIDNVRSTTIREFIIGLKYDHDSSKYDSYIKNLGKSFLEASKLISQILVDNSEWDIDIYNTNNIMKRGSTLVFIDPIYVKNFWESVDMITEITKPEFRDAAVDLLISKGYEQLGSGKFANVFLRKSRPNEVIKLFGTNDSAYESYIEFIIKHQDNPHFPKVFGKPMLITPDYYAVKLERLEPYKINIDGTDMVDIIDYYLHDYIVTKKQKDMVETYITAFPKFKEALDLVKKHNNEVLYGYDIHSGNIMWRGKTLVLTDPLFDPKAMDGYDKSTISEDLQNWFDEKWVDISRKEGGKHPECGASAGKGRRKKSNKAAYPKCVPAAKAKTMTKKEKETASRRKRNVERKSSGNKVNMVKTDS